MSIGLQMPMLLDFGRVLQLMGITQCDRIEPKRVILTSGDSCTTVAIPRLINMECPIQNGNVRVNQTDLKIDGLKVMIWWEATIIKE
jgi:hypothetical protein